MMMLAVDSTAAVATAALFRDGALVAEREADASRKHAETLLPLIEELLEENDLTIGNIGLFAVDIGPGSFTGVRIGVSLVNALAFASGKKIVPVDSLETLALAAGDTGNPVCVMIDARNGNAYAALYQTETTLIAPSVVVIETFLGDLPQDTVLIGDVSTEHKEYPRAHYVGLCALAHVERAKEEVEPVYLRASQAERLKKKSGEQSQQNR